MLSRILILDAVFINIKSVLFQFYSKMTGCKSCLLCQIAYKGLVKWRREGSSHFLGEAFGWMSR